MDDGTIGGSSETVLQDFQTIKSECEKIGLFLNIGKCEAFNPKRTDSGFKVINEDNFELLGSPITPECTAHSLKKRLETFNRISKKLSQLPSHHAFTVLKSSLGLCRLMSTIRASPCAKSLVIDEFDTKIKKSLESILNAQMSDHSALQASLPIKLGGLGIYNVQMHCSSAYISSFHTSKILYNKNLRSLHIDENIAMWSSNSNCDPSSNKQDQKSWMLPIHKSNFDRLTKDANSYNLSRLSSCSHNFSGDWLHCLPSRHLCLRLSNEEFRLSCCLRLGLPVFQPHQCVCRTSIESFGDHCFVCNRNNGKILRVMVPFVSKNKFLNNSRK